MEQPGYFSILSADVRYSKELKANEKLLFSEITALSNKDGYCFASNSYFSKLYDVSIQSISSWINHLKECGFLHVEMVYEDKEIKQRKLYPVLDSVWGIQKNFNTPSKKVEEGYSKKVEGGIQEKLKDNNTSINNTSINKDGGEERAHKEIIELYQNNIGVMSPLIIEKILYMLEDYSKISDEYIEIVRFAIEQAITSRAHNVINYAQALLNAWSTKNIKTLEEAKKAYKQSKTRTTKRAPVKKKEFSKDEI